MADAAPSGSAVRLSDRNHFHLFELAESFELDRRALSENYRKLQAEAHPDRFAGASEAERLAAARLAGRINEAYGTLKSPLARAGYLLRLRGVDTEKVEQAELPPELLMEQMRLREALAELGEGEGALAELQAIRTSAREKLARREAAFAESLDGGALAAAKGAFHEMQFLHKLLAELDADEERRQGY